MNIQQVCRKLFACLTALTQPTLTVDAASLITVVRTVVNFITLFGAVDTGSIAALELIRSTCKQGWRGTQTTNIYTLELAGLLHRGSQCQSILKRNSMDAKRALHHCFKVDSRICFIALYQYIR